MRLCKLGERLRCVDNIHLQRMKHQLDQLEETVREGDDDGGRAIADFRADYFGGNAMRWSAEGRNVGIDDARQLSLEGGWQGLLDIRLGYEELPRRVFDNSRSAYLNPGARNQQLPS